MSSHQSQSHYSRGGGSNQDDAAMRTRFMAHQWLHHQPPRIRPIMIIIVVLALGMFFIGMVLTIIGNWPGYSPASGENPLKIAGPVILSIGGLVFIGCVIDMCRRSSQERKELQKNFATLQDSRRYLDESTIARSRSGSRLTLQGQGRAEERRSLKSYAEDFEMDMPPNQTVEPQYGPPEPKPQYGPPEPKPRRESRDRLASQTSTKQSNIPVANGNDSFVHIERPKDYSQTGV